MPRAQIRREIRGRVNQLTKINDAFNVCIFCGLRKVTRHLQVAFRIDFSALLTVNQIIRNRNTLHGRQKFLRRKCIAFHRLHLIKPGTSLQTRRVARQAAHTITRLQQFRHQPPADISRGSGDEDELRMLHEMIIPIVMVSLGVKSTQHQRSIP